MGMIKEIATDIKKILSNPAHWFALSKNNSLVVQRDNKNEFVIIDIDEYTRLKRQDRQAFPASEMPDEDLEDMLRDDKLPPDSNIFKKEDKEWEF